MASGYGAIAHDQPDAIRKRLQRGGFTSAEAARAALERAIVDIASPSLVTSVAANTVSLQDVPVKPSAGLEPGDPSLPSGRLRVALGLSSGRSYRLTAVDCGRPAPE